MSPPRDSDLGDPGEYDEYIRRVARTAVQGFGNVDQNNGSGNFANWGMTLFGGAIIIMLGFVLNAVYTTNGDMHELKGQNATMQSEISSVQGQNMTLQAEVTEARAQIGALSEKIAVVGAGKRP